MVLQKQNSFKAQSVFFSKSCHPSNRALRHRFHSSQRTLAGVKHYLHYSGVAPISRLQQSWLQGPAFTAIGENRFYRCRQEAGSDSSGGVGIPYIGHVIQSLPSKQASTLPTSSVEFPHEPRDLRSLTQHSTSTGGSSGTVF